MPSSEKENFYITQQPNKVTFIYKQLTENGYVYVPFIEYFLESFEVSNAFTFSIGTGNIDLTYKTIFLDDLQGGLYGTQAR